MINVLEKEFMRLLNGLLKGLLKCARRKIPYLVTIDESVKMM